MSDRKCRAGKPAPASAVERIRRLPVGTDRRAACLLMYLAGLRLAEALALTWEDCRTMPGYLYVAHGKGDKPRVVPLVSELEAELRKLLMARKRKGKVSLCEPVVASTRGALQKWLDRNLNIGAHQLRHSCGYEIGRTLDIDQVAAMLGHSSIKTTQRYRHANPEDIKRALANGKRRENPNDLLDTSGRPGGGRSVVANEIGEEMFTFTVEDKDVHTLTRKELLTAINEKLIKHRKWDERSVYRYLYLVPDDELHDSRSKWVALVGVLESGEMECAGFCDHIDGARGFALSGRQPPKGYRWDDHCGLSLDCTRQGLFRMYVLDGDVLVGINVSSTSVLPVRRIKKEK